MSKRTMRRSVVGAVGLIALFVLGADLVARSLEIHWWHASFIGGVQAAIGISLRRMALAFGLAVTGGVALGALLAVGRGPVKYVRPVIGALRSLPSICWFPLAVLWWGVSEWAVICVTVLGAVFSLTEAVSAGLQHIPRTYVAAAQTMGAGPWDTYRYVLWPALVPALVSGMRQGWSFAWRSLMAAELLLHHGGVGHMIAAARDLDEVLPLLRAIMVVMLVGYAVERLAFVSYEKRLQGVWGNETA